MVYRLEPYMSAILDPWWLSVGVLDQLLLLVPPALLQKERYKVEETSEPLNPVLFPETHDSQTTSDRLF